MLVVVPRAVPHVCREIRRESFLPVALHQIDDVVRHERGKPADAVADLVARSDVGGRRDHHRDRARIAAGFARSLAEQPDAPPDEARIGELDDRPVGDTSGQLERLRPVPRDPHRKVLLSGPVEAQRRAFVRDLAALAEIADDVRCLLEHREVRRLLPEDPPRRVATADAEVHPAARELLKHREHARGDGGLAGRWVRHARPEPHPLGVLRHQREEDVRLLPEHVTVEKPSVREAGGFGEPRERRDPLERVVRFEGETEVHDRRNAS